MRKLRKNRRIVKRTKKKLWKTMSEIKYIDSLYTKSST